MLSECQLKMAACKNVFIVAAKRTPFGTFGGKLKGWTATELCKEASKAALAAGNVPPGAIDSVVVGNVAQVKDIDHMHCNTSS